MEGEQCNRAKLLRALFLLFHISKQSTGQGTTQESQLSQLSFLEWLQAQLCAARIGLYHQLRLYQCLQEFVVSHREQVQLLLQLRAVAVQQKEAVLLRSEL